MAWRSHGTTNDEMVDALNRNGLFESDRIKQAMKSVDRGHYAPTSPYMDHPQSIGHGVTISAPHMHAKACEAVLDLLRPGARVLDVGSGSGYLTHVLAELVKPGGIVVGVEHIQPLVHLAQKNTAKSAEGRELLANGNITYVKADGRKGWTGKGGEEGYDVIHVGAAAVGFHQELIDQLRRPGRLFMPVGERDNQYIYVVDKKEDGSVKKTRLYGVRYVPLTDAPPE